MDGNACVRNKMTRSVGDDLQWDNGGLSKGTEETKERRRHTTEDGGRFVKRTARRMTLSGWSASARNEMTRNADDDLQ